MPRIYLCDDDLKELMKTRKLVEEYLKDVQKNDCQIFMYSDSQKLYDYIESCESAADIFILDMLMPGKDGIELGQLIRSKSRDAVMIYTTTTEDFALKAYGVQAQRYILKPVEKNELTEALDYAYSELGKMTEDEVTFSMKVADGIISVPISQIEYIENSARVLWVHMVDGTVYKSLCIRQAFEQVAQPVISDSRFLQPHKSFLVQAGQIAQYKTGEILMNSGRVVQVSRNRQSDTKHRYLEYAAKQYL